MRVLVLGSGVSGRSTVDYLMKKGYKVEFVKVEYLKEQLKKNNEE